VIAFLPFLRMDQWMVNAGNRFEIAECLEYAAAIEQDLRKLTKGLTEAQFHAPARGGGWSVGFCIEHLVLTGRAFLPKWDVALKQNGQTGCPAEANFGYGWWQRQILRFTENPARLKRKTAAPFAPYARHSIGETVTRFVDMHQELMRRVAGSRGLDAGRIKVQSPFSSWLKYPLGFSFDLVLAHERRHLCQARKVQHDLLSA
jgi:hypothetical protein